VELTSTRRIARVRGPALAKRLQHGCRPVLAAFLPKLTSVVSETFAWPS
jgi:hypothetical protein